MKTIQSVFLITAVLVIAGCGRGNVTFSSSSSSSSEWAVNGQKGSTKWISRTHDGVTRKLETTTDVDIQDGRVTKFPQAALVKIQENGGPGQREAELRENGGKLDLWIKEKGGFRKGTAEEEVWLGRFLSDLTAK